MLCRLLNIFRLDEDESVPFEEEKEEEKISKENECRNLRVIVSLLAIVIYLSFIWVVLL